MAIDLAKIAINKSYSANAAQSDDKAVLEEKVYETGDPEMLEKGLSGELSSDDFRSELQKRELAQKDHIIEELKRDSTLKRGFYKNVTKLVYCWLQFIAALILFDSLNVTFGKYDYFDFDISDQVLIAIVSGTTASVIGLYLTIGRYLFPNSNNKDSD